MYKNSKIPSGINKEYVIFELYDNKIKIGHDKFDRTDYIELVKKNNRFRNLGRGVTGQYNIEHQIKCITILMYKST